MQMQRKHYWRVAFIIELEEISSQRWLQGIRHYCNFTGIAAIFIVPICRSARHGDEKKWQPDSWMVQVSQVYYRFPLWGEQDANWDPQGGLSGPRPPFPLWERGEVSLRERAGGSPQICMLMSGLMFWNALQRDESMCRQFFIFLQCFTTFSIVACSAANFFIWRTSFFGTILDRHTINRGIGLRGLPFIHVDKEKLNCYWKYCCIWEPSNILETIRSTGAYCVVRLEVQPTSWWFSGHKKEGV